MIFIICKDCAILDPEIIARTKVTPLNDSADRAGSNGVQGEFLALVVLELRRF